MATDQRLEIRSTAPSGAEAWTTERVEFGLDYIYQWDLTDRLNVAGSTGFGTDGFADFGLLPDEPARDQFVVLSQSAVLGVDLTKSNSLYVEWYAIWSHGLGDELVFSVFNAGVDHYVTNNFVVDVRAGVGLSDDADDFFCGAGGGYRFSRYAIVAVDRTEVGPPLVIARTV